MSLIESTVGDLRQITVRITPTLLHDTTYISQPIRVIRVSVKAARTAVEPWRFEEIGVFGSTVNETGEEIDFPGRRTFGAGGGWAYTLGDAPEWLLETAREALA